MPCHLLCTICSHQAVLDSPVFSVGDEFDKSSSIVGQRLLLCEQLGNIARVHILHFVIGIPVQKHILAKVDAPE